VRLNLATASFAAFDDCSAALLAGRLHLFGWVLFAASHYQTSFGNQTASAMTSMGSIAGATRTAALRSGDCFARNQWCAAKHVTGHTSAAATLVASMTAVMHVPRAALPLDRPMLRVANAMSRPPAEGNDAGPSDSGASGGAGIRHEKRIELQVDLLTSISYRSEKTQLFFPCSCCDNAGYRADGLKYRQLNREKPAVIFWLWL